MPTRIYYFSGTGNSLYVARMLAKGLGEAEVVPIPQAILQPPAAPAERIGFVFPVYMWGMPLIVERFCRGIQADSSAYCFGVVTCGGSAGGTLAQLEQTLASRNLTLAFGAVVQMPGNYTPLYGAPSETTQRKLFNQATLRLNAILEDLHASRRGQVDRGSWFGRTVMSGFVYRFGSRHLAAGDVKFFADERCNSCGLCAKVCPVGNITLQNGKPAWQHRCEQCMACLQWCPQEAIQFGPRTAGRRRYHHPESNAGHFMLR